nr:TMEM175 family protein [Streptomyces sp. S1D4-11]
MVAFSDGVIAIAIAVTLLVLEIRPQHDTRHLLHGLAALRPSYLAHVLAFTLIGQVWANHHIMFDHIRSADRVVLFLNTVLLMDVALLPFAASVLAEAFRDGHGQRTAAVFHDAAFALLAILFNVIWGYVRRDRRLLSALARHRHPARRPGSRTRRGRDRRLNPLLLASHLGRDRRGEAPAWTPDVTADGRNPAAGTNRSVAPVYRRCRHRFGSSSRAARSQPPCSAAAS